MKSYSIIIPSYNQAQFINETLENVCELKQQAGKRGISVELILVDNCSDDATRKVIESYRSQLDQVLIEPDKGQFDAINKGLKIMHGSYWTWLNTDDLIDMNGFFKIADWLAHHPETDYIYGDITYIDEVSAFHKHSSSELLSFDKLLHHDPSISQPGSFFRTEFTKTIGELAAYHFAFDYDYILRCFKNKARVKKLNDNVSFFRYYTSSKSGSKDHRFLTEQLQINSMYGGSVFSKLQLFLRLRILKRKLFNYTPLSRFRQSIFLFGQ